MEVAVRDDMRENARLIVYGIAVSGFGVVLFHGVQHAVFFFGALFRRATRQRGL
jgi:hypothetical protein